MNFLSLVQMCEAVWIVRGNATLLFMIQSIFLHLVIEALIPELSFLSLSLCGLQHGPKSGHF